MNPLTFVKDGCEKVLDALKNIQPCFQEMMSWSSLELAVKWLNLLNIGCWLQGFAKKNILITDVQEGYI